MSSSLTESPGLLRPVLRLALPVMCEQFLGMLIGVSDRKLAGSYLGAEELAAITNCAYLVWLTFEIFSMVAIGGGAMIARAVGGGHWRHARRVTTQSFLLGAGIAIGASLLATAELGHLVEWLRLEPRTAGMAHTFLRLAIPVVPLIAVWAIGNACLRAAGDVITGLVVGGIINLVNITIAWLLVLGPGPIPKLGLQGIAVGMISGYAVGALLMLALLLRGRSGLRIEWRQFWPDRSILKRLLWIGLPAGGDTLSIVGCQLWFLSVINQLGHVATAAHGVALTVENFVFLPSLGLQVAASTLTGQYLGAKNAAKAERSAWMSCVLGLALMAVGATFLFTQADVLARWFVQGEHSAVAGLAGSLVRTVSLGMPALVVMMILTGALRGAGDTRWPLLFSLIGFLGVRIPAAYWFAFPQIHVPVTHWIVAGWGLGVVGTWYAMVADLCLRATLMTGRFVQGGWKQTNV